MLARAMFLAGLMLIPATGRALECGTDYTVQRGDTLSAIARAAYGSGSQYPRLHRANLDVIGPDPARIRVGMRLALPCAGDGAAATAAAPRTRSGAGSPDGTAQLAGEDPLAEADAAVTRARSTRGVPEGWNVTPTAPDLQTLRSAGGIQIIDLRTAAQQEEGVVPGAVSVPYAAWRGPRDNPGQPPSASRLAQIIGAAGVRLDRPIVLIHSKPDAFDAGRAAYVYWLLKSAGAERIAILQGGYAAWEAARMPVASLPDTPIPYEATVEMEDSWWASRADVQAIADGSMPGALLDGRPSNLYRKLDALGRALATTLPYAQNTSAFDIYRSATRDGRIALMSDLKDQPLNWESAPVVSFCNTGELGALNWFYASEVSGIRNVRLFPESTKGWTGAGLDLEAPALPIEPDS